MEFDEILSRLEAEQRVDPAVTRTANYLFSASLLDEQKDLLKESKELLKQQEAKLIYLEYLKDLYKKFNSSTTNKQYKYAKQIDEVAIAGLGVWQEDLGIRNSGSRGLSFVTQPNWGKIKDHIEKTIFGKFFLEEISLPADLEIWGSEFPLRMSACDASQHRFKLKVPFNKTWATPVVVNNAAGTIKEKTNNDKPKWSHVTVPKDTSDYENWVILGPDDYATMDESDYEWAAKSSMDVGQSFVEETFIFKYGGISKRPDVHFRDGRIFPQDKLMNCRLENRHGQLTRESIFRMVKTSELSKELGILYCGVTKQTNLKVYSNLINWFITNKLNKPNWNPTGNALADSEIVRYLLYEENFRLNDFEKIIITCPILRRFETTSNLNRRSRTQVERDLESLNTVFHSRSFTARDIANRALQLGAVMFFAGHFTNSELYVPRYEFIINVEDKVLDVFSEINKIISSLKFASFDVDEDHLWGLDEPICTLLPTPLLIAHDISKKMGEELASNFAQRTTAEFIKQLQDYRKSNAKNH